MAVVPFGFLMARKKVFFGFKDPIFFTQSDTPGGGLAFNAATSTFFRSIISSMIFPAMNTEPDLTRRLNAETIEFFGSRQENESGERKLVPRDESADRRPATSGSLITVGQNEKHS